MGITYYILGQILNPPFPDSPQVLLYSLTISLFLHFLDKKNPDKTTRVLGIVLIVTHLFSQFWEIPMFIMGHLEIMGYVYLGSIDQLYLILVFYLALRFCNISIAKKDLIILLTPIIFTTIAFIFDSVIYTSVPPLWFFSRCLSCFCLGKFILDRSAL